MEYWPDGKLQSVTSQNRALSYVYDRANRLRELTDPEYLTTSYGWNARDELESVTHDSRTVTYGYDLAGRQVRTHLPNGVAGTQEFDERDRLVRKDYQHSSQPLLTLKYRHNQSGRRIQARQDTPSQSLDWKYAYNDRNELTAANKTRQPLVGPPVTVPTTFTYDQNFNRASENTTTYTPNNADQLTQAGGTSIRYNGAGQADQIGGGGLDATLTYNHRDQITAVNSNIQYRYDGFGQRVQKQVNSETTQYLWSGDEVIKEYTGTGALKADYFLGAGREGIKSSSGWNWYLTDAQDSTVLLTDDTGAVTAAYDYEPYGRTTQTSGNSALYNPYRWTGQQFDSEAGMYYLRARHYHPRLGRFLARDPIGFKGGLNLYAYCGNDPLNHTDSSGLQERPDKIYEKQALYWVDHPDEAEERLLDAGWIMLFLYDAAVATAPAGYYYFVIRPNAAPRPAPGTAPARPSMPRQTVGPRDPGTAPTKPPATPPTTPPAQSLSRMEQFAEMKGGFQTAGSTYTLNSHFINSVSKSGRRGIGPDSLVRALGQSPTPGTPGSRVYTDPQSGTRFFVNDANEVVGAHPANFKK